MPQPFADRPSLDITFVVKNTGLQRRSVKVFNQSIPPNTQFDLMKEPGITEEDIRTALTKSTIKSLFSSGELVIINCTVDFTTSDLSHNSFLVSIGIIPSSLPVAGNIWLTQATWYIDPSNSTGKASDKNIGNVATAPLLTWAEIIRRYGTYSPIIRQSTTFNWLSSHTDNTDPVIYSPILSEGATIFFTGTLTQVQAGTVGTSPIAKARATPQLWTLNLGISGLATPSLAQDVTHGSWFWLYQSAGGTSYKISQPLAATSVAGYNFANAELDTIAATNTFKIYSLVAVNFASLDCTLERFNAGFNNGIRIQNLKCYDPDGPGTNNLYVGQYVGIIESQIDRFWVTIGAPDVVQTSAHNCWFSGSVVPGREFQIIGGVLSGGTVGGILTIDQPRGLGDNFSVDADCILTGDVSLGGAARFGAVYLETGCTAFIGNILDGASSLGYPSVVWGPGAIDVTGNAGYVYSAPALSYFLQKGALQIAAQTTASSYLSGTPSVWNGGIAITPTNLDAPAGASGFGGMATFWPTHGHITATSS